MKSLVFFGFIFLALHTFSQEPDVDDFKIVIREIGEPLSKGDRISLFEHLVFPFEVEGKFYSSKQLSTVFNQVFLPGYIDCLLDVDQYQPVFLDDPSRCFAVCDTGPKGYNVSVFIFEILNGNWMLKGIDLQDSPY